jgi:putative SOS response-associated peptidase YedK
MIGNYRVLVHKHPSVPKATRHRYGRSRHAGQKVGKGKQPFAIVPKDEPLFAFAGLWEGWRLVPHFTKDLSFGARCINARAKTVATLPAYRDCL